MNYPFKLITNCDLSFDDVLLKPQYSAVLPSEVDLSTQLHNFSNNQPLKLQLPIIAAAMDSVCEATMAIAMARNGGLGIIHKNLTPENQLKAVLAVKAQNLLVGAAIGVEPEPFTHLTNLVNAQVDLVVLDSAHAHTSNIINFLKKIRAQFPHLFIVVGNLATKEAATDLIAAGASCLKVGIGPGSICTTRIVAGVGVPQLSAIAHVIQVAQAHNIPVIADGGMKTSGDVTKALALGAHAVMLGSMLAGCDECPGELIEINDQQYKAYVGMGSLGAMQRGSSTRYFQKPNQKLVPEGIEAYVKAKGPVSEVLYQIAGGIKAGMGYLGAANLAALVKNAEFIKISGASLKESHPHSVLSVKQG